MRTHDFHCPKCHTWVGGFDLKNNRCSCDTVLFYDINHYGCGPCPLYNMEPDADSGEWGRWAESVHSDWMYYNDDNPEPDQVVAMAEFNSMVEMVLDHGSVAEIEALRYLQRMEQAAHAAAHAIEEGTVARTYDLSLEIHETT